MDIVMALLQTYWGILVVILGFSVFTIFQRQTAKKIILSLMLQIEKNAETLSLQTGETKFQFIVDKGYQLLPQSIRIFITPAMFTKMAQAIYDEAKGYVTKYLPGEHITVPVVDPVTDPAVVVDPVVTQPTV